MDADHYMKVTAAQDGPLQMIQFKVSLHRCGVSLYVLL